MKKCSLCPRTPVCHVPGLYTSSADQALQMRSNSSKAASGYVYVNRLDAPGGNPVSANTSAADRLSSQL
ncbi:MAG: hypothetical protein FT714_14405 [Pantoea sp. Pent]|nr:hypothetical protein [Pantoea sp. Pent]